MFDWIFFIDYYTVIISWFLINSFVFYVGYFAIGKIKDERIEDVFDKLREKFILHFFILSITSLAFSVSAIPNILVKVNAKRIKIYHTCPQSIKKIETNVLKIVEKLDNLTDKGIDSIEPKETK
jgi:hypothetical protein